jgi:hypothetical protein
VARTAWTHQIRPKDSLVGPKAAQIFSSIGGWPSKAVKMVVYGQISEQKSYQDTGAQKIKFNSLPCCIRCMSARKHPPEYRDS